MLALARKSNESIMIGNDIEITVLEIKGDQVKLGIKAPKSVPIYRKEIYLQIQEENRQAVREVDVEAVKNLFGGQQGVFVEKFGGGCNDFTPFCRYSIQK